MIRPIPEDYLKECEHSGRLEELQIPDHRSAIVYLPFGYDDSDRHYSVFYLIHGGGGDQHSFFSEDGTFKNMLDNMIEKGDMAPLIVVTPTFYPPGHSGQGMSHAAEAVRTFGQTFVGKIIPLVDQTFRTFTDRRHRGIGGFSMGAVATWYAMISKQSLFHWFMPLSGDCWICGELGGGKHPRQTAGLISDSIQSKDFYLHVLTGSEDIAYPNLDPQMQAMKEFPHVFVFGKNTFYSVLEGGVHDYPDIRRYIFNALPEFFRGNA